MWWGGHMFVGDLAAKWLHLFVIKFVYLVVECIILCITCSWRLLDVYMLSSCL